MKTIIIGLWALCISSVALGQSTDSSQYYLELGLREKQAGRSKPAYDYLGKSLTLDSSSIPALQAMGLVSVDLRKFDDAKKVLHRLETLHPNDPVAIEELGKLYFAFRRWDLAVNYGHKMLDAGIGQRVNYMLGKSYLEMENYGKAFRYLDAAYKDEPANAQIPLMFARSFVEMSNYKQAVRYYLEAIALDTTQVNWIYELAMAYAAVPDDETAITYYEKALAKGYKADRDFVENMANSYVLAGHPEKGIAVMEELLQKRPGDIELLYSLGDTYFRMRNYDQAIRYFNLVLVNDREHANSMYMMGIAYNKTGQKEKGMMLCNRAIEIDPSLNAYRKEVWKMK